MKPLLRSLIYVLLASLVISSATGCNSKSKKKKDFVVTVARFYMEANEGDAFAPITLPISEVKLAVNSKPVVTEYDLTGVQLAESDLGKFLIFGLTGDAARDVYRVTGSNQGKRLVLFINGAPVGARRIDRPFNTGVIGIFPAVPEEVLPELVKNLDATSKDIQEQIEKEKNK